MDDTQRTILSSLLLKIIIFKLIFNSKLNIMNTKIFANENTMRLVKEDLFKEGYEISLCNHCMYLIKPIMYNN